MAKRRHHLKSSESESREVSRDALAALLERHALGSLNTVEPLPNGAALLINGEIVARIEATGATRLPWEALVFRRLRHSTDVPVPDVLALELARDPALGDALLLRYVDGVNGDTVWPSFDGAQREQISEELGRMIGSAHALHWPVYGDYLGSNGLIRSRSWSDVVYPRIVACYEEAAALGLFEPRFLDAFVTLLNDGDALFEAASPPTLVHTDLALRHLRLRQEGNRWHIAALLGWGESLLADAAWEWAALWRDPTAANPLPDGLRYGYRERHPLQDDLRVRQRLYRVLLSMERAVARARVAGAQDPATQRWTRGLVRILDGAERT